jgi:hypothetical protein
LKPNEFDAHALQRMIERGVSSAEVVRTLHPGADAQHKAIAIHIGCELTDAQLKRLFCKRKRDY